MTADREGPWEGSANREGVDRSAGPRGGSSAHTRLARMASAERRCVAHARSEHADLWYYRDTDDGLEYLCADAYAQLGDQERLPWQLMPDDAM